MHCPISQVECIRLTGNKIKYVVCIQYSGSPSLVQRVVTIKVYKVWNFIKLQSLKIDHDMFRLKLAIIRWSKKCSGNIKYVGFDVLSALVMKSIILWDMMPCSPLSFNRRFGGTYHLHLQGRRTNFSKKQASRWQAACFLVFAVFISLHGVISQKMIFFKIMYAYCRHRCIKFGPPIRIQSYYIYNCL
jgi:hypothetical protein